VGVAAAGVLAAPVLEPGRDPEKSAKPEAPAAAPALVADAGADANPQRGLRRRRNSMSQLSPPTPAAAVDWAGVLAPAKLPKGSSKAALELEPFWPKASNWPAAGLPALGSCRWCSPEDGTLALRGESRKGLEWTCAPCHHPQRASATPAPGVPPCQSLYCSYCSSWRTARLPT